MFIGSQIKIISKSTFQASQTFLIPKLTGHDAVFQQLQTQFQAYLAMTDDEWKYYDMTSFKTAVNASVVKIQQVLTLCKMVKECE